MPWRVSDVLQVVLSFVSKWRKEPGGKAMEQKKSGRSLSSYFLYHQLRILATPICIYLGSWGSRGSKAQGVRRRPPAPFPSLSVQLNPILLIKDHDNIIRILATPRFFIWEGGGRGHVIPPPPHTPHIKILLMTSDYMYIEAVTILATPICLLIMMLEEGGGGGGEG